jgi:hypothetical protein
MCQIRMIYSSISVDMLSGSDQHLLRRCDVYYRGFVGVGMRDPEGNRESICGASKGDRQNTVEVDEQGRRSIFKSCAVSLSSILPRVVSVETHCIHQSEAKSLDIWRWCLQDRSMFVAGRDIPCSGSVVVRHLRTARGTHSFEHVPEPTQGLLRHCGHSWNQVSSCRGMSKNNGELSAELRGDPPLRQTLAKARLAQAPPPARGLEFP